MSTAEKTIERPRVEEFSDFREYLHSMVDFLKATRRGFSYRRFAKAAGFSSASFLTLVIQGKRNLSQRTIGGFARALGLNRKEHDFFEALVLFSQAKGDEEKNRYYDRLKRAAGGSTSAAELGRDQYDVYSLWYAMPIREMLQMPDFQEDPEWIAKRVYPRIKPHEARRALDLLERAGLATRDEEGTLKPAHPKLRAVEHVQTLAVRNYHRSNMENAIKSLDGLDVDERNVTSLTISLTPEQYEEVCDRITQFQQELLDQFDDETTNGAAEIFVLGCQLVPVTKKEKA